MTLANDQMKAGRFLKLHNGRRTFARITNPLKAGKRIVIGTATRATQYGPKHLGMFTLSASGDVYVARGKRKDCLTFGGLMMGVGLRVEA